MEIATLIERLDAQYAELFNWLENYPDADLNIEKHEGKWTAGQHLDHLIKSTKPINKAMRLPKLAMRTMFGKNNRDERTFEALVEKYQKALLNLNIDPKIAARFAPSAGLSKTELKTTLENELASLKKNPFEMEGKRYVCLPASTSSDRQIDCSGDDVFYNLSHGTSFETAEGKVLKFGLG